jgi:hypothetical protein
MHEAGEARSRRFFDNLLKIGYKGRIGIEGQFI